MAAAWDVILGLNYVYQDMFHTLCTCHSMQQASTALLSPPYIIPPHTTLLNRPAPCWSAVKATMNSISGKWDVSATDASHDAPSFYTMKCVQGIDSSAAPCDGPSEGDWPASGTVSGGSVTATLNSLKLATSYMCYAIATNTAGEACSPGTPVATGERSCSICCWSSSAHLSAIC
jgi:hypothetical protein